MGRCRIGESDREVIVSIRDLCPEGVGFEGSAAIDSEDVELKLEIEGHEVTFKACLKWTKVEEDDYGTKYIGGFQITDITEQEKAILLIYYTKKLISLLLSTGFAHPSASIYQ